MKKFIIHTYIFVLFFLWTSYSIEISYDDEKVIEQTNDYLNSISEYRSKAWFEIRQRRFENAIRNSNNEYLNEVLRRINNTISEIIIELNIKEKEISTNLEEYNNYNTNDITKNIQQDYNKQKYDIVKEYLNWIVSNHNVSDRCILYFDEIDEIAKLNDFPTALIISTWYREYSCIFWNPNNWRWPFQITSHYYKPWEITMDEFKNSIQNFIDFSKAKWNYFENTPSLKNRFWEEPINISYNEYSIRDIRLHSILYNWIFPNTTLENSSYANWNLDESIKTNRDWIVTKFIKILNWEMNNK